MNSRWFAIAALAALLAAGCRTRPEQRAVFDAYQEELRRYEGIIYDLEYTNQTLCDDNERLKKRLDKLALDTPGSTDDAPSVVTPRTMPSDRLPRARTGPRSTRPGASPDDIDLSPPEIDTGPAAPGRTVPGGTQKPITPEVEPAIEPTTRPQSDAEPPVADPRDVEPPIIEPPMVEPVKPAVEPVETKPAIESPSKEIEPLPDVDLPPATGRKPSALLPDDENSEEPPPRAPSVLRQPLNKRPVVKLPDFKQPEAKQPTSEMLPAPRSDAQPKSPEHRTKLPELLPTPTDKKVSQLYIDPQHTRGVDLDQRSGDDGLRIVLEPRNAAGEFVPVTGRVSVAVIDPARPGEAARVAHWEFDPESVGYQLRLSGQRNIPLEQPWTGPQPQHSQLKLFARFETADGEQVETSRDINIVLPGQVQQHWTPRSTAGRAAK